VRRLAVTLALAIAPVAGWVALAGGAGAHAALRETVPANGEVLEEPPTEIRLAFTEPPDLSLTIVGLVDRSGAPVSTGPVEAVAGESRTIRVRVDDLPDGVYTVSWRTVSRTDGHPTAGAFSFGVGVPPEEVVPLEQATQTPPPTALAVLGRWCLYVGLAVLLGGAIAGLLALGPSAVARPRLLVSAWLLAAVGVTLMTLEERTAVGVSLAALLRSDAGAAFVRLGVAVGMAGVAVLVACLRTTPVTLALLAASSGAAMAVRAAGGHAGTSTLQVVLQGLHFAAVGAWVGGLVWLALAVRRSAEVAAVRRYSNVAAGGLVVLLATGVLRSIDELGGPAWWLHAFDTDYGTALVVKLALVVPLVALGARNRFRNVRRYEELGRAPLLRTVGGEVLLAAGVLATTAVLTGLPPQLEEAAARPRPAGPLVVSGSDFATTTRVRLEISPGTAGPNAFVASVTDFDTGEPVVARRVSLTFSLPDRPELDSTLELEHRQDGTWQAGGTSLAVDATWDVTVLVEDPTTSVEVPLTVTPRPPDQQVDVSRAEGQPDLYTFHFEGGVSIQSYVDPGVAGRTNQVHVTAFDADGAELPLESALVVVTPPVGDSLEPDLLRLSAGHFTANVDLVPGTTSFSISATTRDGGTLTAFFEQDFES
jgi:copper transport protein